MVWINVVSTAVMVGVIWIVQRVHYPLLAAIDLDRARQVARDHQRRIAPVVGLPMAAEGTSSLYLVFDRPAGVELWMTLIGAALLGVVLLCTVVLSVPLHTEMAEAPRVDTGARLVRTNWPRTIGWSARLLVCMTMIAAI